MHGFMNVKIRSFVEEIAPLPIWPSQIPHRGVLHSDGGNWKLPGTSQRYRSKYHFQYTIWRNINYKPENQSQ